jgi:GSCFA family
LSQEPIPAAAAVTPFKAEQPYEVVQDGKTVQHPHPFWRGEKASFAPDDDSFERADFLAEYLAKGGMPEMPFISPKTTVVAFGSCFARHISDHLAALGFRIESRSSDTAYISVMDDGMVNSYAIRQQFEWAWENQVPEVSLWHGYDGAALGYDEAIRLETKRIFDAAEVFIITLGLSEVWYDEPTGHVFWRAVPRAHFDATRHKFRVATHAENLANLKAIHAIIRKHKPDAQIVVTLSPIPLTATFRPIPCMVADGASKAVLRSAIDELMLQADDPGLFYFPSYEVVKNCFLRPYIYDRRHVHFHILDLNMYLFERYFCRSGMNDAKLQRLWARAQRIDGKLARLGSVFAKTFFEEESAKRIAGQKAFREERRTARQEARREERLAARQARRAE